MSEVVAMESQDWSDRVISGTIDGLLTTRDSGVDQLAAATGIAYSTLYRKLRAGRWKASEVKRVADAFKVSVGDLYDGRVTPGPGLPRLDSNQQPSVYPSRDAEILPFRRTG